MKLLGPFVFVVFFAGCNTQDGAQVVGGGGPDDAGVEADMTPDPWSGPSVCTSGTTYSPNDGEGAFMRPGEACVTSGCHATRERFAFGGTIYPTGHEPDDCNSVDTISGTKVIVTDSAGKMFTALANTEGNFYVRATTTFKPPYTAKLVDKNGKERAMTEMQTSGDCNSCHTEQGTNSAPGRIVAP